MPEHFKKLYLFNLSTDLDNPLLAFTHDWIIEASKIVESVEVISTHVGSVKLPRNVRVREIGGGTLLKRFYAFFKCIAILNEIIQNKNDAKVFYHMTNKIAFFLCIPLRLMKIKQAIWYSHSAKPFTLRVASRYCNLIFSSAPSSLPIKNSKCRYVGHGINFSKFPKLNIQDEAARQKIVSLGRIAPIKNIEKLLEAVSQSLVNKKEVDLIGPNLSNIEYQENLIQFANDKKIKINFIGAIKYDDVPLTLAKYSICYTGNPSTTDKAAIESAAMGCFVLSTERDTQKLTGMAEFWEKTDVDVTDLVSQINFLLNVEAKSQLRLKVSKLARERNDVRNVIHEVMIGLRNA